MPKTQPQASTETILVPIRHIVLGVDTDPTADSVSMAFLPYGQDPLDSDAHPGTWQTWPGPIYYAACLVGPKNGGVALPPARYIVWVHITDSPDVPWLRADTLIIT